MYKKYNTYDSDVTDDLTNSYKMMSVQNRNHRNELIKKNTIVCIKVGADWCSPCKTIMPAYKSLAQELMSYCLFAEEDLDNGIKSDYNNINAIPAFLVFFKGQLRYTGEGADILPELRTVIMKFADVINENRTLQTVSTPGGNSNSNLNNTPMYKKNYGQS